MEHLAFGSPGPAAPWSMALRSDIGSRESQQDRAWGCCLDGGAVAVVCDGMGGLSQGALASRVAVETMEELFTQCFSAPSDLSVPSFLLDAMTETDSRVRRALKGRSGGTTAVAAVLRSGKLYWFSVGDSRLYIFRGGALVQATRDHNYLLRLNAQLELGQITREAYQQELPQGDALISYLGLGTLPVYDLTREPLAVMDGDLLLLTTDGLYNVAPQEQMRQVLSGSAGIEAKADALMCLVTARKQSIGLDNTTFLLLEIHL